MAVVKHHLLIDSNYMCWRHYFQMRKLSHGEAATGVMFGFFRDLKTLRDSFETDDFVFCFDHGENKRKAIDTNYKSSRAKKREEATLEEQQAFKNLVEQMETLRTEILPELGFRNILFQSGFEADDLIASVAKSTKRPHRATMISGDHDLYQLLSPTVSFYAPVQKEHLWAGKFIDQFGLKPKQWTMVKAIAGCNSDDVKGVPGVGEATALKFMKGTLDKKYKSYKAIMDNKDLIRDNLEVVSLPLKGTRRNIKLLDNDIDESKWDEIMQRFGMQSLRNKPPRLKRKGFINDQVGKGQFV